jgi:hypothetical protein
MTALISAIAVFDTKKIKGIVRFTEDPKTNTIIIDIDVQGLKKNGLHGFHVHECGDISEQCESMCAHFNPFTPLHISNAHFLYNFYLTYIKIFYSIIL